MRTPSAMTFAPSTTGAIRTALVTSRDAIAEELTGILAPTDQQNYLAQLIVWCHAESLRVGAETGEAATHA